VQLAARPAFTFAVDFADLGFDQTEIDSVDLIAALVDRPKPAPAKK